MNTPRSFTSQTEQVNFANARADAGPTCYKAARGLLDHFAFLISRGYTPNAAALVCGIAETDAKTWEHAADLGIIQAHMISPSEVAYYALQNALARTTQRINSPAVDLDLLTDLDIRTARRFLS